MFCNTEHSRSRQIAECSFLSNQKGTEKVAATSEARGTARGLHAPKTPKEEVALAKTGKNAWKDCFSCRFGGAPPLIRVCPNPRGGKIAGIMGVHCYFIKSFFCHHLTGQKVRVSLPTFFAKKVGDSTKFVRGT